jgi:hypothetical protein
MCWAAPQNAARWARRSRNPSFAKTREGWVPCVYDAQRNQKPRPPRRGLVSPAEEWRRSSYRFYLWDEAGTVRVNEGWTKISFRVPVAGWTRVVPTVPTPALRKLREGRGTHCVGDASEIKSPGHPPIRLHRQDQLPQIPSVFQLRKRRK